MHSSARLPGKIALIVTGGVAAYKAGDIARAFVKAGVGVQPVLTEAAQAFVSPLLFSALTGKEARTALFSPEDEARMGHIALAREAEAVIIAPATAHFIAKAAHGLADDLASTLLLAADIPVFFFPAMNPVMYASAAVRDNIALLRRRGYQVCEPETGLAACGETGAGRLPEADTVLQFVQEHMPDADATRSGEAAGLRVVITSGATREPIDPVRYLSNYSSGKQGAALAEAFLAAGAEVAYIHGAGAALPSAGAGGALVTAETETAEEMLRETLAALPADIVFCAAAVCDWRPLCNNSQKIKKSCAEEILRLDFTPNPDILKTVASLPGGSRPRVVAGFAAETAADDAELIARAKEKLRRKGCDIIAANNVSGGAVFGEGRNRVLAVTPDGAAEDTGLRDKSGVADALVKAALRVYRRNMPASG